jgi:hypothetical protein
MLVITRPGNQVKKTPSANSPADSPRFRLLFALISRVVLP